MASSIEISGALNEAIRMRADIFGRKMTQCSFTAALTPPTVESIPMQMAKLYIDNEDGTIGTTEKASTLIAFTFTIETGLTHKRYGDGSIDFTSYAEGFKKVTLKATLAFNSGAEVERLKFDGETMRLIRLEADGSLITGATYHELILDLCGIYTDWGPLGERDGEDIAEITMEMQRGANYTKGFEVAVTNEVATLP